MAEKKIAECIKILINLGNYSNITVAKYDERVITYETEEERIEKEEQHTAELLQGVIRGIRTTPAALHLDTEEAAEKLDINPNALGDIENRIQKEMPKWLGEEEIPNIANGAARLKDATDNEEKTKQQENDAARQAVESMLENDDSPKSSEKPPEVEKTDVNQTEVKSETKEELDDLFGEDDLFE